MNRIDRLVLKRIGGRVALTVAVFFGLICLVESLDTWRFNYLTSTAGAAMAVFAVLVGAARWSIKVLELTVLLGALIGLTDLAQRRELTVIKSTGMSIWRVMRAPAIALFLVSIAIPLGIEPLTTSVNRTLNPSSVGASGALTQSGEFWLEQTEPDGRYIISAKHATEADLRLSEVTVFFLDNPGGKRLTAPRARLEPGHWTLPEARLLDANGPAETLRDVVLPTATTAAELRLKLRSTEDFTFFELAAALSRQLDDPALRAAAATRLMRLVALPLLLVGSLFIAFAFSAGYRRSAGYGAAVLHGILLGFVVLVITELAEKAGSAGVLDPTLAAAGPAVVAIVVGAGVLLFSEDGQV